MLFKSLEHIVIRMVYTMAFAVSFRKKMFFVESVCENTDMAGESILPFCVAHRTSVFFLVAFPFWIVSYYDGKKDID